MREYEGVFILDVSAGDVKVKLESVTAILTREGAEITQKNEWGRRKLAYPIDGKPEGHYVAVYFKVDPLKIERLRELFRLNENLLRHMIVVDNGTRLVPGSRENAYQEGSPRSFGREGDEGGYRDRGGYRETAGSASY